MGAIGGLENQLVTPRRKILHLNDQAEGNDGISFLDVFSSEIGPEKNTCLLEASMML